MTQLLSAVPAGEDGGDIFGGHAVQLQMDLWRVFDRGPPRRERRGGPHLLGEQYGAGRVQPWVAPPPREQARQADGTCAHDNHRNYQDHVEHLGRSSQGRPGELTATAAPGCRSAWYRPRCERR